MADTCRDVNVRVRDPAFSSRLRATALVSLIFALRWTYLFGIYNEAFLLAAFSDPADQTQADETVNRITAHLRGLWGGLEEFCAHIGVAVVDALAFGYEDVARLLEEFSELDANVAGDPAVAEAWRDRLNGLWSALLH